MIFPAWFFELDDENSLPVNAFSEKFFRQEEIFWQAKIWGWEGQLSLVPCHDAINVIVLRCSFVMSYVELWIIFVACYFWCRTVACCLEYRSPSQRLPTPCDRPNQTSYIERRRAICVHDECYPITTLVPPVKRSTVGSRGFPMTWNALPEDVASFRSEYAFRRQLKTWLFKKSFPDIIIWYWLHLDF